MAFDCNNIALPLFRAGYHAWRHTRASGYPAISAMTEAREVKGALQEADQIARDYDGLDKGVQQARARMESRELEVELKEGNVVNLVRCLESYLRNGSDRRLWGWWHAGQNAAALELQEKFEQSENALENKEAVLNEIHETRKALRVALGVAGVSKSDLEPFDALAPGLVKDRILDYLKANQPPQENPDFVRLRAQHAAGDFPEEALLLRLGCSVSEIEYLRLLHKRKPLPISYEEAGEELKVSGGAVYQRFRQIPEPVGKILVMKVGGLGKKAWRT